MRHRVKGKKLNRSTSQRKALFKSLISALVIKGEIQTTLAKAKVIKRLVDKLITRSKKTGLHSRRVIQAFFNKRTVTNKLVDELAPKMAGRTSGYTKMVRLGRRRGDNTMMVKVEFTDKIAPKAEIETKKPKPKSAKSKKAVSKLTTQKAAKELGSKTTVSPTSKLTSQRTTSK